MVHDHDSLDLRLRENRLDLAQLMLGGNENDAGTGVAQGVGGLLGSQRGVDRNGDGAEQQDGEVGGRPLRAILAENGDSITFVDAPFLQRANGSGDVPAEV